MPKKKAKKQIKRKKIKKLKNKKNTGKKKVSKSLGRRIEVKTFNEAKPETILGQALEFAPPVISEINDKEIILEERAEFPVLNDVFTPEAADLEPEVFDEQNVGEEMLDEEAYSDEDLLMDEEDLNEMPASSLTDRQKHIIMYIGITSIMIFILFFWAISIKNSIGQELKDFNAQKNNGDSLADLENSLQLFKDNVFSNNPLIVNQNIVSPQIIDKTQEQKADVLDTMKEKIESLQLNTNQPANLNK